MSGQEQGALWGDIVTEILPSGSSCGGQGRAPHSEQKHSCLISLLFILKAQFRHHLNHLKSLS